MTTIPKKEGSMTHAEQMAHKHVEDMDYIRDESRNIAGNSFMCGFHAALELAASKAFEKVRCDDRTDRWQVANEVSAHIRALVTEPAAKECECSIMGTPKCPVHTAKGDAS